MKIMLKTTWSPEGGRVWIFPGSGSLNGDAASGDQMSKRGGGAVGKPRTGTPSK